MSRSSAKYRCLTAIFSGPNPIRPDFQSGQFVTEQLQRPAVATVRCPTAAERDQLCFRSAVKLSRDGWSRPALQDRLSLAHELLPNADHLSLGNLDLLGNFPIAPPPVRVILIGQEQHPCPTNCCRCDRLPTTNYLEFPPLRG